MRGIFRRVRHSVPQAFVPYLAPVFAVLVWPSSRRAPRSWRRQICELHKEIGREGGRARYTKRDSTAEGVKGGKSVPENEKF